MRAPDEIYLQNLISACDLGAEGLANFRAYLQAWLYHPNAGRLPETMLDGVLYDLKAAGLEAWLSPRAQKTLYRILCGKEQKQ